MKEKLQKIKEAAISQLKEASSLEALNEVRLNFLGKKGELT
ncbi:MAG: phenylalanine--tRNA ligase subunit alpha, partial [Lachnospiraceae bacterium]|nr:phenylalanine--tRNA ligase subunit alpha [Lachnospiraceae bacterium]